MRQPAGDHRLVCIQQAGFSWAGSAELEQHIHEGVAVHRPGLVFAQLVFSFGVNFWLGRVQLM
jgi:hypothetical protein